MEGIKQLIDTARTYCAENFSFWVQKDRGEYLRYHILESILNGVEEIVGKNFESFDACKTKLKEIAEDVKDTSFGGYSMELDDNQRQIINEERKKFIDYINAQNQETVKYTKPLPYRRKLSQSESENLREKLLTIWNFDGYVWNPLQNKSPKPTVFLSYENVTRKDEKEIKNIVKNLLKTNRLYKVSETLIDYEMEFSLLNINLYEEMIFDDTFEWVIYGSHESTLTFGGDLFTKKIQELYKDRKEKLNQW